MSQSERLQNALDQAKKKKEKQYDWLEAAKLYEKALGVVKRGDFLRKGEVQERIGYCFHRAAFQAESQEEFKQRMQQAFEAYERARDFYEKLADEQKAARMFRCEAIIKYLGYWLTSDPSEKRALLDDCLELESKALAVFSESGEMLEYGRTYNELSRVFWLRAALEWDGRTSSSILEKGLKWGEKAVAALSEFGDSYEIARAYLTVGTCFPHPGRSFIAEPEEKEKHRLKAVKYLSKAADLSEKIGDTYLLGLSHQWLGMNKGGEEGTKHFEKAQECGEKTRDNYLKCRGTECVACMIFAKAGINEDPDQKRKLAEKAVKLNNIAQPHYSIMSFQSPCGLVGLALYYICLAMWETDQEKKLEFLEKSEKAGMEALKAAEDSDIPYVTLAAIHRLSRTLQERGRMEPDFKGKRILLEKALKYRERTIEILERSGPFRYLDRGGTQNFLAEIKAELGYLEPDLNSKGRLFEEAVLRQEK